MSIINTPTTIAEAPEASRAILETVEKQLGRVPNMFRLVSNSPVALGAYAGFSGALAKGKLAAPTRERIALAIAEINGCDYCLSAHSFIGKNLARLSDEEIAANRLGRSLDAKAAAAVGFAKSLAENRGGVAPAEVEAVRAAGYSDEEILEIVAHVALGTFTNYVNRAFDTEVDFPSIERLAA